jgi:hypothetical protein
MTTHHKVPRFTARKFGSEYPYAKCVGHLASVEEPVSKFAPPGRMSLEGFRQDGR